MSGSISDHTRAEADDEFVIYAPYDPRRYAITRMAATIWMSCAWLHPCPDPDFDDWIDWLDDNGDQESWPVLAAEAIMNAGYCNVDVAGAAGAFPIPMSEDSV